MTLFRWVVGRGVGQKDGGKNDIGGQSGKAWPQMCEQLGMIYI